MYIESVYINSIRSIDEFKMEFDHPAGWHVIIGENGAGKSSVVRSIAATLIGPEQITAALPIWEEWLSFGKLNGEIKITLSRDKNYDLIGQTRPPKNAAITNEFILKKSDTGRIEMDSNIQAKKMNPRNFNWGNNKGWFSAAFGPFRRFTGGNEKWNKVFYSAPKLGAHLSVFREDIALSEALDWLNELDRRRLKQNEQRQFESEMVAEPIVSYLNESARIFESIKTFINGSDLLPHQTKFDSINIDGEPIFLDIADQPIPVTQLSDGFRSILSLTFELIRQLIQTYSTSEVFPDPTTFKPVSVPGVVIIDEIDAHLHPTWQTSIGNWFVRCFPNIQFIVTTHSPLICRAVSKTSTIWRLSTPGSEHPSKKIIGDEREKLIFGNILDAYGTEAFGKSPVRSAKSNEQLDRLGTLNMLSALGKTTDEDEKERTKLQRIHGTDDPTGF